MKVKIFFLIFSLQFILYSCFTVKYYNSLIKKYADEVKVTTGNYIAVGFVLDISEFKKKDPIIKCRGSKRIGISMSRYGSDSYSYGRNKLKIKN